MDTIVCTKCDHLNPSDTKFCEQCGTKIILDKETKLKSVIVSEMLAYQRWTDENVKLIKEGSLSRLEKTRIFNETHSKIDKLLTLLKKSKKETEDKRLSKLIDDRIHDLERELKATSELSEKTIKEEIKVNRKYWIILPRVILSVVIVLILAGFFLSSDNKPNEKQLDETRRVVNEEVQKENKLVGDINKSLELFKVIGDYAEEDNRNPGYIAKNHNEVLSAADAFVSQVLLVTYETRDLFQYINDNAAVLELNKSTVTRTKESTSRWSQSMLGALNATKTRLFFTDRTYGTNSNSTIQYIDKGIATVQNFNEALKKDMVYNE